MKNKTKLFWWWLVTLLLKYHSYSKNSLFMVIDFFIIYYLCFPTIFKQGKIKGDDGNSDQFASIA